MYPEFTKALFKERTKLTQDKAGIDDKKALYLQSDIRVTDVVTINQASACAH